MVVATMAVGFVIGGNEVSANEAKHEVRPGDTLGEIAKDNETSVLSIMELNQYIQDKDLIFPEQIVVLPGNDVVQAHSNVISNDTVVYSDVEAFVVASNSSYEIALLERLVEAESKGEPYSGKVAVAKVILNRVANGSFPNSIQAVINEPGQFDPVSNGSISGSATNETIQAVSEALLEGGNENGATFFYNPAIAGSQSWFNTLETVGVIGNHTFKR